MNSNILSTQYLIFGTLMSVAVVILFLLPIYINVDSYPFWEANIAFLVVFATLIRWQFTLRHTWFARVEWVKVVLFFLCIPLLVYLFGHLFEFILFFNDFGLQSFLGDLPHEKYQFMNTYIRAEMIFFGVSSIILTFIFAGRLLMSIWLVRNRNRV